MKPLKLQTRIIASSVVFVDVFVFNVEVEYNGKLTSVVIGIYSILELVSSVNESVVVGDFIASIFDFTRTRNADVGDAFVVVVCSVLTTAKKKIFA
jgi:hypothetical protein